VSMQITTALHGGIAAAIAALVVAACDAHPTAQNASPTPKGRTRLRKALVAGIATLLLVGCSDLPTGSDEPLAPDGPQLLINGVDDFDRTAVAAIMVYQPDHPTSPGWRSFCSGTLIHKRVLLTAGHCVQGIERQLNAGVFHAAWISFQHDPLAHFNADPAVADPASGGWYAIESLHDNPDNPDFSDFPALLEIHPDFHDSGAIILRDRVKGIQPMKIPSRPGEVENLLGRAGCVEGADCGLVGVGYGLTEFPLVEIPPLQVRRSAPLLYKGIDALWVRNLQAPPGSAFGALCFGDSGGPVVLLKDNGRDRIITAMVSPPEDPFAFPCTNAHLSYRVDTETHLDFIREVILQSLRGGPN
jgi:hypothetical protein